MTEMQKVKFLPGAQEVLVKKGTRLLDAAFQAEIPVDAPCGGRGNCKKCQMEIIEGGTPGICLACQTYVERDMLVRICRKQENEKILSEPTGQDIQADSGLKVLSLKIHPIVPGEAESVWERFKQAIQEKTGETCSNLKIDLSVLNKLYPVIIKGNYHIFSVLYENHVLDVSVDCPQVFLFAADIGTTTLVGYLLDGITGTIRSTVSEMNPQYRYGADVITRASYVKEHGDREMAECIRESIGAMIKKAAEQAGVPAEHVYLTVLAGNTCMHHLFLQLSPESLVHAPYSPVIREPMELPQGMYLKHAAQGGIIKFLPNIAGFVGADTSACLLACGFKEEEKLTLLMDIGTNGEIVLGNKRKAVACSTAAGPAFEGAKIKCGMRGANGAIDHVYMKNEKLSYTVLGETTPQGICGSGLLDLMAILVEYGFVDSMGILKQQEELSSKEARNNIWRLCGEGLNRRFILYGDGREESSVYITQKDIGEIQLAKAAMAAGIQILCLRMNVMPKDIEKVLIAGAFGNYMDSRSACKIGLIPAVLEDKIEMIGNAAGEGAMIAAKSRKHWKACQELTAGIQFVELASEEKFSDFFVEELAFPIDI